MGEAQYDFYILVTCLFILALQIHNPFQSRPVCHCTGGPQGAAPAVDERLAAVEPQRAQSRRPREASAGGMSESDMLKELHSIQAKAKDQQETLAAAGKMPPPSPLLEQLRESEAASGVANAVPRQPRAPAASFGAAPGRPADAAGVYAGAASQAGFADGAAMQGSDAPLVRRRSDLGRFLQSRQPGGLGVMLGVGRGEFALQLLSDWSTSMGIYLVDPYIHIAHGYRSSENLPDREHQMVFENLRQRLQPFEGRYVLARDFSYSFVQTYKVGVTAPGPPTFIYIDANHAEDAVTRDMELWWPHLVRDGIMAGSTYVDDAEGFVRVKSAVDKFAARQGASVYLTHDDMPPTWFIFKP